MTYRLGCALVSTNAQDPRLRIDALTGRGTRTVIDHNSGVATRWEGHILM